jgi:hypothetical protein
VCKRKCLNISHPLKQNFSKNVLHSENVGYSDILVLIDDNANVGVVTYQMLSEVFWTVRRMVTRASLVPTWRASSLTGLSRDCPAKAVEAHAVAAAIAARGGA